MASKRNINLQQLRNTASNGWNIMKACNATAKKTPKCNTGQLSHPSSTFSSTAWGVRCQHLLAVGGQGLQLATVAAWHLCEPVRPWRWCIAGLNDWYCKWSLLLLSRCSTPQHLSFWCFKSLTPNSWHVQAWGSLRRSDWTCQWRFYSRAFKANKDKHITSSP